MAGGKYRSFLIHVKAVNERGADEMCSGGMRPVVRLPSLKHQGHKGYSLASLLAKVAAGKVWILYLNRTMLWLRFVGRPAYLV